jgi:hypothetical protein
MSRTIVACGLSLAAALGVSRAEALEASSPSVSGAVQVERFAGGFSVTVLAAADRKAVLDAVCLAAEASCIFPETIPATNVGPLHVRGSWSQVADALLKDSNLSFATGGLSGGPNAQPVLVVSVDRASDRAGNAPGGSSPSDTQTTAAFDPADPFSGATPEEIAAKAELEETPAAAPVAAAGPMILGLTPGASVDPGSLVMTPFSTADGSPILSAAPTRPSGLSTQPTVTPFSNSDGSLIIAPPADGPSDMTPFSSPDGEPIRIQPQPGATHGSPFPPAVKQN